MYYIEETYFSEKITAKSSNMRPLLNFDPFSFKIPIYSKNTYKTNDKSTFLENIVKYNVKITFFEKLFNSYFLDCLKILNEFEEIALRSRFFLKKSISVLKRLVFQKNERDQMICDDLYYLLNQTSNLRIA